MEPTQEKDPLEDKMEVEHLEPPEQKPVKPSEIGYDIKAVLGRIQYLRALDPNVPQVKENR